MKIMSNSSSTVDYWVNSDSATDTEWTNNYHLSEFPSKEELELLLMSEYRPPEKKNKYGNNTKHISKLLKKMGRK